MRDYPLYRAGIMLLAQVLVTGRWELHRLLTALMTALLHHLSHPWDQHPNDHYYPA